jgi:MFS family permease
MAFGYLIPQYFMGVLGYNASSAGLWVLPRTAMVAIGCWIAGRYLQMTGTYKNFVVSLMGLHIVSSIGTFAWTAKTAVWFQLLCMTTEGFVFGSVFVATMVALVADISHSGKKMKENKGGEQLFFLLTRSSIYRNCFCHIHDFLVPFHWLVKWKYPYSCYITSQFQSRFTKSDYWT